jgi:hypothetical protein
MTDEVEIRKLVEELTPQERQAVVESLEIRKRSDAEAAIETIAKGIAEANPELAPAEVYRRALSTPRGREVRAAAAELPLEERAAVTQDEERRETHPVVKLLDAKATEIRKNAAAVGQPISDAEAYAEAMNEYRELRARYYAGRG